MKILFIGCVKSSYILLKEIINAGYNVVGVITQKQSDFNSDFCDLSELCISNGISYIYQGDVNSNESIEFIHSKKPDVIYCFGWSRLIKEEVLEIPPLGVIGFHPAELPNNRGRHPLIWALILGLKKTASTFFVMDKGADTGDIVSQRLVQIDYEDDASSLYDKILDCAKIQVIEFSKQLAEGKCIFQKQSKEGNSWRKRTKNDGKIDWRMSSNAIYNLVRGLTKPYVGSHFEYDGKEVKVWKVEEVCWENVENIEPGKVLKVISENDYYIKVSDNVIHILESDSISLKEGEYL